MRTLGQKTKADNFSEAGASLVEFAIVFPLILTTILAILQLWYVYYQRIVLNDALRTAGRAAISQRNNCAQEAHDKLQEMIESGPISSRISWSDTTQIITQPIGGVQTRVVEIDLRATLNCALCDLLFLGADITKYTKQKGFA